MKKLLLIAGIIILAIGGGFVYLMGQSDAPASQVQTVEEPEAETPAPVDPQTAGAYVDYSEELVASTSGTKVLFFHAAWCPQCRQLESEIKAGSLPEGTTIFKVDYDTSQALRQKYGVTLQTTLVKIDDQGNLVEKYVAYDDPTLTALKQNIL